MPARPGHGREPLDADQLLLVQVGDRLRQADGQAADRELGPDDARQPGGHDVLQRARGRAAGQRLFLLLLQVGRALRDDGVVDLPFPFHDAQVVPAQRFAQRLHLEEVALELVGGHDPGDAEQIVERVEHGFPGRRRVRLLDLVGPLEKAFGLVGQAVFQQRHPDVVHRLRDLLVGFHLFEQREGDLELGARLAVLLQRQQVVPVLEPALRYLQRLLGIHSNPSRFI